MKNIIFDGDWTHNLLIYSQTLYHCATEAYYKLESILYILLDCSLFINILIIFLPITFLNHVPPTPWVFNPHPLHLCLSKPFYSSASSSSSWFPAHCHLSMFFLADRSPSYCFDLSKLHLRTGPWCRKLNWILTSSPDSSQNYCKMRIRTGCWGKKFNNKPINW